MPFRLGPVEIILILVIFFIIFGAGRLPQVGEAIGKGLRFLRGGKGKEKDKDKEEEMRTTGRSKKKVISKFRD